MPGDVIQLASSPDSSKQLLADFLPCGNVALGAVELTAARYSEEPITVVVMESNFKLPCVVEK